MQVEKYIKDGKVAVLYSPGFGAGWSTWNEAFAEFLVFDKGLVELALSGAKEDVVREYLESSLPDSDILCLGGWKGIYVKCLPVGTVFHINEYEGSEAVIVFDENDYFTA